MKLTSQECRVFYKLHPALMWFVNGRLNILPDQPGDSVEFCALAPEKRVQVRDILHAQPDLIDQFVQANPFGFDAEELEILRSWKRAIVGSFYVFRYLRRYTVFLSCEKKAKAYGVLALADPMDAVIGPHLPVLAKTVLLPLQDKIIYDGLIASYRVSFGGGIKSMLNDTYRTAKADFGIITSVPPASQEANEAEEPKPVIVAHPGNRTARKMRVDGPDESGTLPLRLTQPQRRAVARLLPDLTSRLLLDTANQRTLHCSLNEIEQIAQRCRAAALQASNGTERNSLRHVVDAAEKSLADSQGIGQIPASERLYQFKVTLLESAPPIWRRIQVKNCTLDKLHEHIQTAMGWTNSHLHQFEIDGVVFGDPELLYEGWMDETPPIDSLRTRINQIIPQNGKRCSFRYEYDFGDGWEHEVLFEGCLRAEKDVRYPLCVEGERACPPEDIGGVWGYAEYLEALADPEHEQHEDYLAWSGQFDSEAFDAKQATIAMRRGLPDWRSLA